MKSAVYKKAGQVGIEEVKHPSIQEVDDVIIRVVRACVCGSDLWSYRNPDIKAGHKNSGHEAIGIVEEVGEAVTTVKPGDTQLFSKSNLVHCLLTVDFKTFFSSPRITS